MDEDSEILEYETEQTEQAFEIQPIPVCVSEPVVTVATVPQHVSCTTIVVATGTDGGVEQILPQDPLRVRAQIIVSDMPVVLCHSRPQAGSSSNQVASVPNPSGAYLPVSVSPVVIQGTQPMYVAATSATAARVTVIAERRSA
jgi:hypothetical protein